MFAERDPFTRPLIPEVFLLIMSRLAGLVFRLRRHLLLRSPTNVPDEFRLLMDENGLRRLCRVVWKRGNEIGVAFQRRFGN